MPLRNSKPARIQDKANLPSSQTNDELDYVDRAIAWAESAIADKNFTTHCKWVRKAAERFVADLKRTESKTPPFTFSRDEANRACGFIEQLPHVEGKWETTNIILHDSHVFFVVCLFGFRKLDGGRRFTTAVLGVARKNAKSTIAAAILIYCLCCEDELGPQIISAATTGSQARIIFNIAKRMVEKTADLREAFTLDPYANAIARYEVGGNIRPINSKASTQDGLNPSHVALDEIHAHKNHDLLNVIRSAAGARSNPLFLYTTTEGYENPGPWGEIRHFGCQILDRIVGADHFLFIYFSLDEADEDFDESKWCKANPLIDINPILRTEIRKECIEAKGMPGRHAEFRIKRLNRRSASATSWIDLDKWRACNGAVDLDELKSVPCWGGLDLASTRDLCSLRLVWRLGGRYYTWGRRWVPKYAVAQRTERGTVPYAAWVESGVLEQTEGDVTDYAIVEKAVYDVRDNFNLQELAFDRWNAVELCNRLTEDGLPMIEFIQGPKSYHPAMQELERAYVSGLLNHGGDPVLLWCASNLVARKDVNLNQAPDKLHSAEKIDDIVALLMAIGRAVLHDTDEGIDGFLESLKSAA